MALIITLIVVLAIRRKKAFTKGEDTEEIEADSSFTVLQEILIATAGNE